MLNPLALIATLILGFSTASYAVGCEGFLGSALHAQTSETATNDLPLFLSHEQDSSEHSKLAATYLRLVEYGLSKLASEDKHKLLASMEMSAALPVAINPFATLTSTLGVMLKHTFDNHALANLHGADWESVRRGLQTLLKKYAEQNAITHQSRAETQWVPVFHQAWKILLGDEVSSSPTWQQIAGEWYLTIGSRDHKLYVLKFDAAASDQSQALKIVGEYQTEHMVQSSPTWQQIAGDWYLAVGSDDFKLYVLKFVATETDQTKALTVVGEYKTGHTVQSSPTWQQIAGEWYLAVGSDDFKLYVLKFVATETDQTKALTVVGEYETGNWIDSSPSWQQIAGEWYLTVCSNDKKLYVLKFDATTNDQATALRVVGEYQTGHSLQSSPAWQQIAGEWYLAVGSNDQKLYVLKFESKVREKSKALTVVGKYKTGNIVHSSPSWQQIDGEWYLTVGSRDKMLYVLKFDATESDQAKVLTVVGEYKTGDTVESSTSWLQFEGEWYLAVGARDNKLYVLRFDINKSIKSESITVVDIYETKDMVDTSPKWQQIGDHLYIAVGSDDHHLHLIEFGKNIKRGGK